MVARKRILIVDDDPVVRDVLAAVLEEEAVVIAATNGPDAVRIAAEVRPDVIILDVMMPGMTGFEVCRTLRQDHDGEQPTIVMLTALDSAAARDESIAAGADLHLTKPFSALSLLAAVSEAVSPGSV